MKEKKLITEELVIVGSRYGDLTDVLNPYYEKGDPIEPKAIESLLGSDVVYLQPVSNSDDPYAIGVFLTTKKRLGFVWKDQSPSLRELMSANNKKYCKAHIKRINTQYGLIMAEANLPDQLSDEVYRGLDIDEDWARNIPETVPSITEQSLNLGFALLCDELSETEDWNDSLGNRFANLKKDLSADLSGHHIKDSRVLYDKMKRSAIKEVRESCDEMLNAYVSRGSDKKMKQWANEWLPSFFMDVADSDLLELFEASNYTLERVEALLEKAPGNLFYLYKFNRERFAYHLYYMALPEEIYNRLLTLLAVREAMLAKKRKTAVANRGMFDNLPDNKQEIIRRVENYIDRGDWQQPATSENIKAMMRQVLGVGSQRLTADEEELSKTLWDLFETGQGERVSVTFANLIGYFWSYQYLPSTMKGPKLCQIFFRKENVAYQNINKGRPGNGNIPPRFKNVLPLLDTYRPKPTMITDQK